MSKWLVLISERMEPEELVLDFSYLDIGDLIPVVILCAISILFTALWLLVVWEYMQLRDKKNIK